MTPRRPYIQKSIEELESLFAAGKCNASFLRTLSDELSHRKTNRAMALAERVRKTAGLLDAARADRSTSVPERPRPPPGPSPAPDTERQRQERPEAPFVRPPGPRPAITNDPSDILKAWTALEVLSPQGFRREADLVGGDQRRIAPLDQGELPWERGEPSRPRKRLYYEIILGTIELGPAVELLLKVYSDARPDASKINRRAPIASLLADKEGRPLRDENGFVISSFAWGVPIALRGDLTLLARWPSEARRLTSDLIRPLLEPGQDGEIPPLTSSSIRDLYGRLVDTLQLAGHVLRPPYFALRRYEFFASKIPPEPSLLNSFYLEDLDLAGQLATAGRLPQALRHYLGQAKPTKRIDLLEDNGGLRTLLRPSATPLGRWPGPGRFPLALLQQAAVNATMTSMDDTGILAVNGPPGTGKTTLLRDVVAARIVERASAMVQLKDPASAFSQTSERLQRGGATITLHRLDDRLKGFEMVVASSNNKAVENVSAELPSLDAIASDAIGLRYFSSISDKVLQGRTWGAISAVLGNAANRYQFSQSFWRDEEHGLSTYLNHAAGTPQFVMEPQPDGQPRKRWRSVVALEQPPSSRKEAAQRWQRACGRFQAALEKARAMQAELQATHDLLVKLDDLIDKRERQKAGLPRLAEELQRSINERNRLEEIEWHSRLALIDAEKAQADHATLRPGFLARLFRTRAARAWTTEHRRLLRETRSRYAPAIRSAEDVKTMESRRSASQSALQAASLAFDRFDADVKKLQAAIAETRSRRTAAIPDDAFFAESHETIQTAHLWFDATDNIGRDDVFEAAMGVHRAFVDCAADPIRQNLAIFTETFGARSIGTPQKDARTADLWATFFLVVPVVSTTFASVRRMFSRLPMESLGWLLVDEAGQALPQAAVGAIMRSKRVVAVGDPLQIEPVVTLPSSLTEEICGYFGVDALAFNAPEASVQTLADAASPYRSRFPSGSGHRDVGLPLLVHRRCDGPMFDMCNEIAYANLMVQAKTPSSIDRPLGPSRWIDVVATPGPDKWCEDEATKLIELLNKLRELRAAPDIYIITPFVIVQDNLRDRLAQAGTLRGWVEEPRAWAREHVGTVHTVQGREAETVFLVLGAQAPSQGGARNWAGGRPNLANVAVSRARASLYVIGNRALWRSAGVFRVLDARLPQS